MKFLLVLILSHQSTFPIAHYQTWDDCNRAGSAMLSVLHKFNSDVNPYAGYSCAAVKK